ncbi:GNAT family N-acetyltransferase [Micromonospora zhanjiangensis]
MGPRHRRDLRRRRPRGPVRRHARPAHLPVDPTVADVGFLTTPAYRGRGYLPAALGALAAWAFTSLGLARIEWRANVGNHASRRAAEKAGFVFEGTARHAVAHRGKRVDAWVAALLPDDLGRRG